MHVYGMSLYSTLDQSYWCSHSYSGFEYGLFYAQSFRKWLANLPKSFKNILNVLYY